MFTKEFVTKFYDPSHQGVAVLSNHLVPSDLVEINEFVKKNDSLFEIKREKFIENNQTVSLIYRGPFEKDLLKDSVFKHIMSHYFKLRQKFDEYSEHPFKQGTSIEVKLIHYPVSELGVGIHRDLSSNINLVVFYNLTGEVDLKTYETKAGDNPVSNFIRAGDISLMRAPRIPSEEVIRPFHGVEKVAVPRTVLVIREIDEVLEKITNKDNWMGF